MPQEVHANRQIVIYIQTPLVTNPDTFAAYIPLTHLFLKEKYFSILIQIKYLRCIKVKMLDQVYYSVNKLKH